MGKTAEEAHREIIGTLFNKDLEAHKAYFNSGHILHHETVAHVHELVKTAIGDEPLPDEVMPIVFHSGDVFGKKEE